MHRFSITTKNGKYSGVIDEQHIDQLPKLQAELEKTSPSAIYDCFFIRSDDGALLGSGYPAPNGRWTVTPTGLVKAGGQERGDK